MSGPTKTKSPKPKLFFVLAIVCLLIVAGIAQISRPYPPVEGKVTSSEVILPGQFSVTFPEQGEGAVGTDNLGVVASSNDQTSVPIASLTKMMTAYLVLKAYPLKPGEDGPTLTMNAQDLADFQKQRAGGGSYLEIAEGETLTERQLLEGLLLPSGNNIASTLGRWVSGSDAAFVAKMNDTAKALGMNNTHYEDASGVNPATVSCATDQIKIAQAAMADPIFQEIVALPQATLPIAGTVFNVNSKLGKNGIVGIKTGSSTPAGGCFVSATPVVAGNEKHFIIAAVLGQKTAQPLASALDANVKILDEVRPEFKVYPLTQPAAGFGQLTSAWHSGSGLKAKQSVEIFGYPGMKVALSLTNLHTQLPVQAGKDIAILNIKAGQSVKAVPLQSAQQIEPPSLLWRLLRF